MKQILLIGMLVMFASGMVQAQNLGIGTDTPDASALLEIQSTDKGLLVPRLTSAERLAIPTPANALLVYDTDSACFYYYKLPTTTWINLCTAFSETDPKVGINTTNYVSKWNGSSLVTSNVYSSGTFTGINRTAPIGSAQFVVEGNTSTYGGMYVNTIGTSGFRKPFYGYALGGLSNTWSYLDEATNQWRKILSREMMEQKLLYCHSNPLQGHWNLAKATEEYFYSSAFDYENNFSRFNFLNHYINRV